MKKKETNILLISDLLFFSSRFICEYNSKLKKNENSLIWNIIKTKTGTVRVCVVCVCVNLGFFKYLVF